MPLRANRAARDETRALLVRNFRYATGALCAIALALILLVALDTSRSRWLQHGRSVARIAREAQISAAEQHAALLGYASGHGTADGDALDSWAGRSLAAVDSLVLLTADNPAQQDRANRYRQDVTEWARAAAAGFRAPGNAAVMGAEAEGYRRARASGDAFLGPEEVLYRERSRSEREAFLVTGALLFLVMVASIAALRPMRRRMLDQADRLILGAEALETTNSALQEHQLQLEEQNEALRERTDQVIQQSGELQDQATQLEEQEAELEATLDELRASEDMFRAVVNSMTDTVFTLDRAQRCTHVFGAGGSSERRDPATLLGRTPEEIFGVDHAEIHRNANDAALRGEYRSYEFEIGPADARRAFAVSVAPLRDSQASIIGILGISRDVTEQRARDAVLAATQEKYRHAQKLEAIGQLAGGVAHDFNNLLTVVIAYADMLLGSGERDPDDRASLSEIKYAAERGANLTRQLLAFSRRQTLHPQLIDLNEVVRRMKLMLTRTIDASIALELRLSDEEVPVFADFGQLEQILMNLAVNARDAMPDGGTLTISTANRQIKPDEGEQGTNGAGDWFGVLWVQDDGIGMDEETLAHIAEPFFTTKPVGKGTGLGMATVHGIVHQTGGQLVVTSAAGEGTTCRVVLPRAQASLPVQASAADVDMRASLPRQTPRAMPAVNDAEVARTATILLVDDDDAIRSATAQLLRRVGYTVITAVSAVDALRLLERDPSRVALVLSDMVMPAMSGRELAYEVRVRFPSAAIVLMSGYTKDRVLEDEVLGAETSFIAKPFAAADLYRVVSDALIASRRRAEIAAQSQADEPPTDARRALDSIVNGVDAVVWEASAETGELHYVNRRGESLLGYPLGRWREPAFFESIVHDGDRARVLARRREAAVNAASFHDEYRVLRAGGDVVWVRDMVQVAVDANGAPRQLRGVMVDISDQKRSEEALIDASRTLERERQFLSVVLENLSDAVVACDAEGKLTLFNAAIRELHGLTVAPAEEVESVGIGNLYHADGTTPMRRDELPLFRALRGERVQDSEMIIAPKLGGARLMLTSGRRFADGDGQVLGAVVAMRDVTDIRRAERDLVAAKEAAELANRTKSHFLALISHELRTPLNAVIGFANVLYRNKGARLSTDDLLHVERIRTNGSVLLQLVNDLLELTDAQSEAAEDDLVPVDLGALVADVVQRFAERASAKSLTLQCAVDAGVAPVRAHHFRLQSVLSKVIDNAIKFTAKGSIRVHVRGSGSGENGVRIEVVDTGVGIAPENLEKIFEPFRQTEEFSRRHHGGSGLGLPLAREHCRTMGCRMSVSSEEGVGSRFTIRFDQ